MKIYDDIKELNSYAKSKGWYFGAPINYYILPSLEDLDSISAKSYTQLFKSWEWQIEEFSHDRRKQILSYFWAFQYIYIIQCLITGEKDGKAFELDEITKDNLLSLGFKYPDQFSGLNYIYEGLKSRFGFTLPKDQRGHRLFITGIGRQSGYFYEKYSQKFTQFIFPKFKRNYEDVIVRSSELIEYIIEYIPESQIMRDLNGNLDYNSISEFFVQLSKANNLGIFNLEHLDQLTDLFNLPLPVTERILRSLQPKEKLSSHSLSLGFGDNGLFYNFLQKMEFTNFGLIDQDAFIKLDNQDQLLSYSYSEGGLWKGLGQTVDVSCNPEVILKFKDQQTVKNIDITPRDLSTDPVIVFNEKRVHQANGIGCLHQGKSYFIVKNPAVWTTGYSLSFLDTSGQELKQNFYNEVVVGGDEILNSILVRDNEEQVVFELTFKGKASLWPKFSEEKLCSKVKGKRTYRRFPTVISDEVESYDSLRILKMAKCILTLEDISLPVNLDNYIDDCESGNFELEIQCGERKARRSLTVLPNDLEFSPEFSSMHHYSSVVELSVSSDSILPDGKVQINLNEGEVSFKKQVDFGFNKPITFSGEVQRAGAYISLDNGKKIPFSNEKKTYTSINLDNLTYSGELTAFAPAGSAVGIRLHGRERKEVPDYFRKVRASGSIKVSIPDIRRSCNPAVWDNCQYISLLIYTPEGQVMSGGILKADSFSRNKFMSLEVDSLGTLKLKKDVCHSLKLRETVAEYQQVQDSFASVDFSKAFSQPEEEFTDLGVVLIPIESQEKPPLLLLDKPELYSGDRFQVCNTNLGFNHSENIVELSIPDYQYIYGSGAGKIAFLVELNEGKVKRLSRGGFIPGSEPSRGRIMAFSNLLADQEIEQRFNECAADIPAYIEGVFKNAEVLEAWNYLSLISALNPRETSGFVFRAVDYWIGALVNSWVLKFLAVDIDLSNTPDYEKISHIDNFWSRQLFSYEEVCKITHDLEVLSEEALTGHLIRIMNKPCNLFSSWEVIVALLKYPSLIPQMQPVVLQLKSFYECKVDSGEVDNQLNEFMKKYACLEDQSIRDYNGVRNFWVESTPNGFIGQAERMDKAYLKFLSWQIHLWRLKPSISNRSNFLRDQLQHLRDNYSDLHNYLNILLVEVFIKEQV